MTSGHLNRIVRQTLGQSTKGYIQSCRMEEARHLLRYTSLTVANIANRLSFETPTYFVRAFVRATGQTPLQFRSLREK